MARLTSMALASATAIVLPACSGGRATPNESPGGPGAETRGHQAGSSGSSAPGPGGLPQGASVESGGIWELAGAISALRKATPRAVSQHLNGDLEAEVLANEAAKAYPALGPARPLPPGSVLVDAHYRPGSSAPVVYFVMDKRPPGFDPDGGDWEYLIVEPSGAISQRGRLSLCARCHAEAPHDHVFGRTR